MGFMSAPLSMSCVAPVSPVGSDGGADWLFITTLLTSIATASFGISKFVKSGPARVVRNDKCLMGFCTFSFIVIFLSTVAIVFGKAIVIATYMGKLWHVGLLKYKALYVSAV